MVFLCLGNSTNSQVSFQLSSCKTFISYIASSHLLFCPHNPASFDVGAPPPLVNIKYDNEGTYLKKAVLNLVYLLTQLFQICMNSHMRLICQTKHLMDASFQYSVRGCILCMYCSFHSLFPEARREISYR